MKMNSTTMGSEARALLAKRQAGELPRIDIAGQDFVIDWRLKELRSVDDLGARIDLSKMAMSDNGENYLCFYHLPTKCVALVPENIKKLPKNTVMLEIPYELKLDPVGVAREYGLEDKAMLRSYPIQQELKARVIPLEETGLPEMIRINRIKAGQLKKPNKHNKGKGL